MLGSQKDELVIRKIEPVFHPVKTITKSIFSKHKRSCSTLPNIRKPVHIR